MSLQTIVGSATLDVVQPRPHRGRLAQRRLFTSSDTVSGSLQNGVWPPADGTSASLMRHAQPYRVVPT